jgi:uncharacterized protein (TIGR02996 family)
MATTPETGAALLRAVVDEPDDDLPRLAYADWCEEAGDSGRAEFIRVQLELAKLAPASPTPAGTSEDYRLRRREQELLDLGSQPRGFNDIFPAWAESWQWRRGFVEKVACTLDAWLAHGPALARAQPVGEVRLTDKRPLTRADCYVWYAPLGEPQRHPHWLPFRLARRLSGGRRAVRAPVGGHAWTRFYDAEAEALADLSQAAIALAKGTPPGPARPASLSPRRPVSSSGMRGGG